jgi:hypothetical protein
MELNPYLALLVDQGGSDLFFSVGARPEVKVEGRTLPVGKEPLTSANLAGFAAQCLDEAQRATFEQELELNSGLSVPGIGRFRLYLFRQRGEIAMVVRHVKDRIPSIQELSLPPLLEELVMQKRGLVLVVGATGTRSQAGSRAGSRCGRRTHRCPRWPRRRAERAARNALRRPREIRRQTGREPRDRMAVDGDGLGNASQPQRGHGVQEAWIPLLDIDTPGAQPRGDPAAHGLELVALHCAPRDLSARSGRLPGPHCRSRSVLRHAVEDPAARLRRAGVAARLLSVPKWREVDAVVMPLQ